MLRIAVCDDMAQDLKNLVLLINQYLSENNLEADIKEFSHPDALLAAIRNDRFHIYILDIVMPMINGLELGKELRRQDLEAQIIFATTEPQFALRAYASFPINYLIKPIDKQQLFDTLNLAIAKINLTMDKTFVVKTTDSIRVVKLSEIAFCEYRKHSVAFSLTNCEELISRTIREKFSGYIMPILEDRNFLQCHASFVVNMKQIERFTRICFTLYNGKTIPIAAKQYASVRDKYMDYMMAKGGLL